MAPSDERLRSVCFGGGQFVAVGYAGTILTSRTGREWTRRASGTEERLLAVAYGNDSRFLSPLMGWFDSSFQALIGARTTRLWLGLHKEEKTRLMLR